jgi:predicted amidohydrolase
MSHAGQPFTVACLQVNASNDMAANIAVVSNLTREAVAKGAQLVLMPENVAMMEFGRAAIIGKGMPENSHTALKAFQTLAAELGIWLHCGTLGVLLASGKLANRTYVIKPDGVIAAVYDKIHMFDVDLGGGERYHESATFDAGSKAVTVDLPWGR